MTLYSNNHANVKYHSFNADYDVLMQYKKRNASKRFDYYDLANNNSHKQKQMITFTYNDDNAVFKLQVINDMRNYFNKLVRNLNTTSIKHFSNIELGENFDNPHVHIQVWHDESDSYDLKRIYDKVVTKYGLQVERCVVSLDEANTDVFHYVVKDYAKRMSDDAILELNMWKAFYRKELGKSVRFSSCSKSVHTKAQYKAAYSIGIRKNDFDGLVCDGILDVNLTVIDDKFAFMCCVLVVLSVLGQDNNKLIESNLIALYRTVFFSVMFEYWVFGFIDRGFITNLPQKLIQRRKDVYFKSVSEVYEERVVSMRGDGKTATTYISPRSSCVSVDRLSRLSIGDNPHSRLELPVSVIILNTTFAITCNLFHVIPFKFNLKNHYSLFCS